MANPFTLPVRYKYKPLGFETFAAPLAAKQKSYDDALTAYDAATYDLPSLPGEEQQVRDIEGKLSSNLDRLQDQFLKTTDFRTATRKLAQLNKYYSSLDKNWKTNPSLLNLYKNDLKDISNTVNAYFRVLDADKVPQSEWTRSFVLSLQTLLATTKLTKVAIPSLGDTIQTIQNSGLTWIYKVCLGFILETSLYSR